MTAETPNYKPGDIIDLSRFEKKKTIISVEALYKKLETISNETNENVFKNFGLKDLLKTDGSINMTGFSPETGGPYDKNTIEKDKSEVRKLEEKFAGVENETDYLRKDQRLQDWKKDKLKQKSTKVELLTTILLHKVLQQNFIVARSAELDDYEAGVDYVVVNPKTGETILKMQIR